MARDSKELAAASKRDSSAMKVIAVLTALFLPGTCIATLFAMPILNWNAFSMRDVMTSHFWLYWAVTIPLTIVVMAIVGAYGLVQARENRRAADKARKNAGIWQV
ncbi:hypothetical protein BU26DRAFT_524137 [Trematosphaeria pertusa]|uniref:Uncharacterized protein n=1 Tax=Trematosphaeria pertusa TaxID=390896 RepID=A0A6A6HY55_9PLEO|nr:uncharacterized protein BU26DRAFT_524137 [Trematosphaeria pertusa]KAF2242533.1 hypothetical protein BU26DRAFT_524137 [Trematosphaeria pertusa]